MNKNWLLMSFLSFFLWGCGTAIKTITLHEDKPATTQKDKPGKKDNTYLGSSAKGIPYFLPKSLIELTVTRTINEGLVDYVMDVNSILVPDTSKQFVLQLQKQSFASDRLCISRSTTGLLHSVQFATDDKTDEILVKLAETAARVGSMFLSASRKEDVLKGLARKAEEQAILEPTTAKAIGDPQDEYFARSMEKQLKHVFKEIDSLNLDLAMPTYHERDCDEKDICFSTLATIPVKIKGNLNKKNFHTSGTVTVVNFAHVGKVRIKRPVLADQITKLGFTDGVLTSLIYKQPSEGLAFVSLPLDIIEAILDVPANFLSKATGGILQSRQTPEKTNNKAQDTDNTFQLECTTKAKDEA